MAITKSLKQGGVREEERQGRKENNGRKEIRKEGRRSGGLTH